MTSTNLEKDFYHGYINIHSLITIPNEISLNYLYRGFLANVSTRVICILTFSIPEYMLLCRSSNLDFLPACHRSVVDH